MRKIVYDLDGTLIPFNTFKGWIILSFFLPILSLKFKDSFFICHLIYLRVLKKINRVDFKEKLMIHQKESLYWKFLGYKYASFLAFYFVRNEILDKEKQKQKKCLATAAPDIYVLPFSKKINMFDVVICSFISPEKKMVEVFGEVKKDCIIKKFSKSPDVFYTDHYDDAPLARISCKTFFIKPSKESRYKIENDKSLINYEFI